MKYLQKLWCFIHGHDFTKIVEFDNGRSRWGELRCMRCNKEHQWQWDYNP